MYFLEENIEFNTLQEYKTFQNWISIQHDKCTFCKTEQETLFPILYSQLSLRRTALGPAPSVRLIESQIKGVKKGRDKL